MFLANEYFWFTGKFFENHWTISILTSFATALTPISKDENFILSSVWRELSPKSTFWIFTEKNGFFNFFQFFGFGSISPQYQLEMRYSILNIDVSAGVKTLRFDAQFAHLKKFSKSQKHLLARTIQHEISSLCNTPSYLRETVDMLTIGVHSMNI